MGITHCPLSLFLEILSATPGVAAGPAASASPGSLLEMQILKSHPISTQSEFFFNLENI